MVKEWLSQGMDTEKIKRREKKICESTHDSCREVMHGLARTNSIVRGQKTTRHYGKERQRSN
jgi:hypothetical protein